MIFGAIMILYSFISLFQSFNGLTKATGPEEVGYYVGYLAMTILLGSLFAWIFWRGITFFTKKPELTKEEIEKKINEIDR